MNCPSCGSSKLVRGDQNLWCANCGFFPIYAPDQLPDEPLSTYRASYVAGLERRVEDLTARLELILDQVDYTAGNCSQTEMVGAVLPREVIKIARETLER